MLPSDRRPSDGRPKPGHTAPKPRDACTCGSLRKASRRISQFYDLALAPAGIKSTQYSILAEVERGSARASITMCELAAAMVMDRSTLGHNLRPLERDRLLTLSRASDDRRKRYVELTDEGRRMLAAAAPLWRRAEGRFEAIYGKASAAQLRRVLLELANHPELKLHPQLKRGDPTGARHVDR